MSTLLKAYLMGSNDPFILAKAYYDEIKKDARAVNEAIDKELPFWNRDLKELESNLKLLKEEITGWELLYKEYEEVAEKIEDDEMRLRVYERTAYRDDKGSLDARLSRKFGRGSKSKLFPDKPEKGGRQIADVQSAIMVKDIPGFVEVLKDELADIEQAIEDLKAKQKVVANKLGVMGIDEVGPIHPEHRIVIQKLGLEFLQEQLDYHENLFQTLKDNKEIPQALPKQLVTARKKLETLKAKLNAEYTKLRERHITEETYEDKEGNEKTRVISDLDQKAPHMKEYKRLLGSLSKLGNLDLDIDSPEWRFDYHSNKISQLKERISRSKEELKKLGAWDKSDSEVDEVDEDKRKIKAKEMGIKGGGTLGWFKRIKPEKDERGKFPPEHSWEKEYYEWDDEEKTFQKIPEKEEREYSRHGDEGTGTTKDYKFSDPEWFNLLARTSKPTSTISRAKLEQLLGEFFKKDRPEFNQKPLSGKTPSGMGLVEYGQDAKGNNIENLVEERPSIRLENLEKLLSIFQQLPAEERERGPPAIIITALEREIGVEQRQKERGGQQGSDFKTGDLILKKLVPILDIAKNKVQFYSDDSKELPAPFLKEISKIKKTMLTLGDLKNFADGKVANNMPSENGQREAHRKRMIRTFNEDKLDKVTDLLNSKNKSGKTMIELISKGWKHQSVFNPKTKRTSVETDKWKKLADKITGDLVKVVDRSEGIVRTEYEGLNDAEFERILKQMKDALQQLENSKNQERTENAIEDLRLLYNNLGEIIRKISTKVSKNSTEWKTIIDVYSKITDEIMNIPEVLEKNKEMFNLETGEPIQIKSKTEWKILKPVYGTDAKTGNQYIKGFEKEFKQSAYKNIDRRREIVEHLIGSIRLSKSEWKGDNPYSHITGREREYIESMLPLVRPIHGHGLKGKPTREQQRIAIEKRKNKAEYRRERLIARILKESSLDGGDIEDKHLLYGDEPMNRRKLNFGQKAPDPFDVDVEDTTTSQSKEIKDYTDVDSAGEEPKALPPQQDEFDEALQEERTRVSEETGESWQEEEVPEEVPEKTEEDKEDEEYEDEWNDEYDELSDRYERMGDDY